MSVTFLNWLRGVAADVDDEPIADGNIIIQDNEDGETADMYVDIGNDRLKVGGGGHVIQNAAGTDVAQEPTMQFVDAAVTDDSTNHKTKIENVKEITEAELATAPDGQYIITDSVQIPTTSLQTIYPVGSIYLNANNVNPATFLGFGTWTLMSEGYLKNSASAASGGSSTSGSTTLTANQIPVHTHTATTESKGAHTHTATTQSTGAHTHTLTTQSVGNHTHTATTQSAGSHTHNVQAKRAGTSNWYYINIPANKISGETSNDWYFTNLNYSDATSCMRAANDGAHTHTLTTQNTGAHTHTATTQSVGNHTHTLTTESKGDHTHTLTTSSIGGGEGHTHTVEPPYIRVYAFQRTA